MGNKKVAIIGLDSAPPSLIFDRFLPKLPNLRRLIDGGAHGTLRSCHPPITVPAWMVMSTSRSPGTLGLYGFRARRGQSYTDFSIPSSHSITQPKIWDILGHQKKSALLIGVPPSFPPPIIYGHLVSCFLTPNSGVDFTYPRHMKGEVQGIAGEYVFDIEFRTDERDQVLQELFDMTEKRWRVAEHLLTTKPWDLFMMVEIGVDRLHHCFWKFFDPEHPHYEPGNKYEHVALDYYRMLDELLARLLERMDDDTTVIVASDHGTKGMRGAFCVNEWLYQRGYLVLKRYPDKPIPLSEAEVDWDRTQAWGWGGYYARVFLNVRDREPQGFIATGEYEAVREELAAQLQQVTDPMGRVMDNLVYKPEDLYPEVQGDASDLMVYFDNLYWRSAGTIGHGTLYLSGNDTGPDDAVHDWDGILILNGPEIRPGPRIQEATLLDVAPTVLGLLGVEAPNVMEGHSVL